MSYERDKFRAPLLAIIPQTYGEAVHAKWIPGLRGIHNYEWDNRTTEENAAWVIGQLRARIDDLRKDLNEQIREEQRSARDAYAEGQWAERERHQNE